MLNHLFYRLPRGKCRVGKANWSELGVASTHYSKMRFFTGFTYLCKWQPDKAFLLSGLPHLLHMLLLLFLAVNFSLGFSKGLFEVESRFFHFFWFVTTWGTCQSHCLTSKLWIFVILESGVAGSIFMPANDFNFDSRSLNLRWNSSSTITPQAKLIFEVF